VVRRWIQQQNRELSLAALDVCLGLEKRRIGKIFGKCPDLSR
jgi:hypothetical protein